MIYNYIFAVKSKEKGMNQLLIIKSIMEGDMNRLQNIAIVLSLLYLCVFIAILVDLAAGVKKAMDRHEEITATGLTRTVNKVRDNFLVLLLGTLVDCVISLWYSLPIATALVAIGIILIQAKSVFEKKKVSSTDIQALPEMITQILANKDKFAEFAKTLENQSKVDLDYDKDRENDPEEKPDRTSERNKQPQSGYNNSSNQFKNR